MGRMVMKTARPTKYTVKRVGGDGYYDWALLADGRPVKMGMARWEANWARDRAKAEQAKGV